jgi:cobalt-zinc-cadmium efflux system membrane fusion protein
MQDMRRPLFVIAVAVTVAAGLGFAAGHAFMPTAPAGHRPAPATVAADPSLPATITMSEQELANLQLQVGRAEMGPLARIVSAPGAVGYDQLRIARITPPARGRIETIDVAVGDRVTAGQRLATLDNFELNAARSKVVSAEAGLNQAQARAATADAAVARAATLIRAGGMAQSELDSRRATAASAAAELRTRQAELQQYQEDEARLLPVSGASADARDQTPAASRGAIAAPFAGVVDSISVAPGEIVDPSARTFTVADLATVWVQADVAESDLGAVKVGDAAQVRVSAYPGRVFTGRVTYISDQIDPATGTAKVRCAIPNADEALRINMFATTSIISPQDREGILVPSGALQNVNGQSVIFVQEDRGNFTWRVVQTGLNMDGRTQIISGLAAGTPIVTDGSYWLKAALMQSAIPDEG